LVVIVEQSGIEALMKNQQWDEAVTACRSALQVTPVNARIHAYLGMCYFRKAEYELASESFRRATCLDPKMWEAGAKLAQCYDRLHRREEAFSVAKQWLCVNPSDRSLQALVQALGEQVQGNRLDGWERTRHLAHKVQFAQDEE